MARSTQLLILVKNIIVIPIKNIYVVILIKNIKSLYGRKLFLYVMGSDTLPSPVTYHLTNLVYPLPTNLVHPFTVRVTGIKASNNSRKF